MPPQEHTALLPSSSSNLGDEGSKESTNNAVAQRKKLLAAMAVVLVGGSVAWWLSGTGPTEEKEWIKATGPYKIVNVHEGRDFFEGFTFYKGADSLGSAGYLTYKAERESFKMNLANVTTEEAADPFDPSAPSTTRDFVYMSSLPTEEGPRDSVRLEGKTRYNRGLFVLDLRHLPTGCGVWPAFWLTDETDWPDHGEIDVSVVVRLVTLHCRRIPSHSHECLFFVNVGRLSKESTLRLKSRPPCTHRTGVTCTHTFPLGP